MFYNLFELGEGICIADNVYSTFVHNFYTEPAACFESIPQFFAINPLALTRKDANVTAYRNILVEFDNGSIAEQQQIISDSGCPFTTLTYSGGKSMHMIISLAEPCKTRAEYDALVERIYRKFPTCDTSARNPSRFSRTPGAARGRVTQSLVACRSRVSRAELENFLGPAPAPTPRETQKPNKYKILLGSTMYFLAFGAPAGAWNRQLFLAALNMFRSGFTFDEAIGRLEEVTGHLDASDRRTVQSALNLSVE